MLPTCWVSPMPNRMELAGDVPVHESGLPNESGGNTRQRRRQLERVELHRLRQLFEPLGPAIDELAVHQAGLDDIVDHTGKKRNVGAGYGLQVQVGDLGCLCDARVDDDQLRSRLPSGRDVLEQDRMRLKWVVSPDENTTRLVQIAHAVRHSASAKNPRQRVPGWRMAHPRAVVDIVGPDNHSVSYT